jgi:hypothetical protein
MYHSFMFSLSCFSDFQGDDCLIENEYMRFSNDLYYY